MRGNCETLNRTVATGVGKRTARYHACRRDGDDTGINNERNSPNGGKDEDNHSAGRRTARIRDQGHDGAQLAHDHVRQRQAPGLRHLRVGEDRRRHEVNLGVSVYRGLAGSRHNPRQVTAQPSVSRWRGRRTTRPSRRQSTAARRSSSWSRRLTATPSAESSWASRRDRA